MADSNLFYGKNPVIRLLKSGKGVDTVYISQSLSPSVMNYYIALAKERGAVVKRVNPAKLKNLTGSENNQGIAAFASSIEYFSLNQILDRAKERDEDPFVVLCDGIEDPHNLGAIIRSALLLGAHGIVIPRRGGAQITPTVHKTSSGAALLLPVARVANIGETVRELKKAGVFVYCLEMSESDKDKTDLTGPVALVVGNEGSGVTPLVKKLCDGQFSIPMPGKSGTVESLNASVAAGIAMYEVSAQRRARK